MSEINEGECPDDGGFMDDAIDCDELDEVGCWRQGPVRSKIFNIQEVKDVQLEGLLVLPCYDIETEEGHEGTTTVMELADDEAENEAGGQREGICDACLGSVIIGETCICSADLFDGPRGREQDIGGLAARESREKVDCMYRIVTENEGDYLYSEAGTPVSREESDMSGAEGAWNRLADGTQEDGRPATRPQMNGWPPTTPLTDGRPRMLPEASPTRVAETNGRPRASALDRAQTDQRPLDRPEMGRWPPTSMQTDGWP
jgi:hypothetical protein